MNIHSCLGIAQRLVGFLSILMVCACGGGGGGSTNGTSSNSAGVGSTVPQIKQTVAELDAATATILSANGIDSEGLLLNHGTAQVTVSGAPAATRRISSELVPKKVKINVIGNIGVILNAYSAAPTLATKATSKALAASKEISETVLPYSGTCPKWNGTTMEFKGVYASNATTNQGGVADVNLTGNSMWVSIRWDNGTTEERTIQRPADPVTGLAPEGGTWSETAAQFWASAPPRITDQEIAQAETTNALGRNNSIINHEIISEIYQNNGIENQKINDALFARTNGYVTAKGAAGDYAVFPQGRYESFGFYFRSNSPELDLNYSWRGSDFASACPPTRVYLGAYSGSVTMAVPPPAVDCTSVDTCSGILVIDLNNKIANNLNGIHTYQQNPPCYFSATADPWCGLNTSIYINNSHIVFIGSCGYPPGGSGISETISFDGDILITDLKNEINGTITIVHKENDSITLQLPMPVTLYPVTP